MTTDILVPQMGNEITEVEITEWLKSAGDTVEAGEAVVTLTTTKMSMDIDAPVAGTLSAIRIEEGDLADIGAVLATISSS
jgi:pyruvate/2-oxoglutarate dehydrogenase complex dihydrolipoamide acyltransferase (E2) component